MVDFVLVVIVFVVLFLFWFVLDGDDDDDDDDDLAVVVVVVMILDGLDRRQDKTKVEGRVHRLVLVVRGFVLTFPQSMECRSVPYNRKVLERSGRRNGKPLTNCQRLNKIKFKHATTPLQSTDTEEQNRTNHLRSYHFTLTKHTIQKNSYHHIPFHHIPFEDMDEE